MKNFFRVLIGLITVASILQSFAKTLDTNLIKAKEGGRDGGAASGRDPGV